MKKIRKRIPVTTTVPRDAVVLGRLGPIPDYLRRGGTHVVKPHAGTKSAKKRQAIREQMA